MELSPCRPDDMLGLSLALSHRPRDDQYYDMIVHDLRRSGEFLTSKALKIGDIMMHIDKA